MEEPITKPLTKTLSPLSQEQFVKSDTKNLLKMTGVISSVPKALTAAKLIEINNSKVLDCIRLGVTKEQTAKLIAADPRNTNGIKASTIMRDLNRAVGDWKILTRQRLASDQTSSSENQSVSETPRSSELDSRVRNRSLIDTNFNEEDVI